MNDLNAQLVLIAAAILLCAILMTVLIFRARKRVQLERERSDISAALVPSLARSRARSDDAPNFHRDLNAEPAVATALAPSNAFESDPGGDKSFSDFSRSDLSRIEDLLGSISSALNNTSGRDISSLVRRVEEIKALLQEIARQRGLDEIKQLLQEVSRKLDKR